MNPMSRCVDMSEAGESHADAAIGAAEHRKPRPPLLLLGWKRPVLDGRLLVPVMRIRALVGVRLEAKLDECFVVAAEPARCTLVEARTKRTNQRAFVAEAFLFFTSEPADVIERHPSSVVADALREFLCLTDVDDLAAKGEQIHAVALLGEKQVHLASDP